MSVSPLSEKEIVGDYLDKNAIPHGNERIESFSYAQIVYYESIKAC